MGRPGRRRPARSGAPGPHASAGPAPAAPLGRRAGFAVALGLLLAWAAAFAPLFAGRAFVLGDAAAYRAYADFSRARWAQQHDRTLWNPYVFMGLPAVASLADPRPQWLPDGLLTLADAAAPATGRWRVPLATLAGALAMAALARSLWGCGAAACALAGGAWLLAPALLVPLAFGHDAEAWTLAWWAPVALAARATLVARSRAGAWTAALALAGALALQALGAHPQFLAYGLLAALVLALPLARTATPAARLAAAAAGALALAMSAATWLPAWRYGAESVRQSAALMQGESLAFSAGARDLLSAVWPHAAGFGGERYWGAMRATDYPHFLGAALAALAVAGALAARARSRAAALGLAALAAFALAAACGARTPLGPALAALPVVRAFRTPITWTVLAQFAAALLAARGLDAAGSGRGRAAAALGVALVLAGAVLLATGAGAGGYAGAMAAARDALARPVAPAVAAVEAPLAMRDLGLRLLLAGAALALAFGRPRLPVRLRAAAPVAAAVLAAADLGAVAMPLAWRATGDAARLEPPPATAAARVIAADPAHRAMSLSMRGYYSNDWISWRARVTAGLHGAAPRRWHDVHELRAFDRPAFLRDASVRWLLPDAGGPGVSPVFLEGGWNRPVAGGALENPAALPRARAVARVVALAGDAQVCAALTGPAFAPESFALTTEPGAEGVYAAPADVRIDWREDAPDRIALAVRTPARAFVVLADAWFPGWRVTIDGAPAALHRVDHVFRGVAVPAGTHAVRFAYVPPGWRAGVALARTGWLVFAAWALALAWHARRRAPPAAAAA